MAPGGFLIVATTVLLSTVYPGMVEFVVWPVYGSFEEVGWGGTVYWSVTYWTLNSVTAGVEVDWAILNGIMIKMDAANTAAKMNVKLLLMLIILELLSRSALRVLV